LNCLDAKQVKGYAEKFDDAHASLRKHINVLEGLAKTGIDKHRVRVMGEDLQTYTNAMAVIIPKVKDGDINAPQDGNNAIAEQKDAVHRLEQTAAELAGEANTRMTGVSEEMAAKGRTTLATMLVLSAVALVVGIVLSIWIGRGITRPLHHMAVV